jgi:hypothetical protein
MRIISTIPRASFLSVFTGRVETRAAVTRLNADSLEAGGHKVPV